MGRDIYVQDLPDNIRNLSEIPDDFVPRPIASRSTVIEAIRKAFPSADLTDPSWVKLVEPSIFYIEANLGSVESLDSFVFHVNGGKEADQLISRILLSLGLRAVDTFSDTGLFQFV
ncbi:hypothetical protein [Mesoterricola silvestris]|uniref:hypothetical protein n=1 Tax=Mesoterricola silvestris TaxID=2927979 RepID=UPI00292F7B4B|nr:hypothetical protein [Mesoterricola silvestris]